VKYHEKILRYSIYFRFYIAKSGKVITLTVFHCGYTPYLLKLLFNLLTPGAFGQKHIFGHFGDFQAGGDQIISNLLKKAFAT